MTTISRQSGHIPASLEPTEQAVKSSPILQAEGPKRTLQQDPKDGFVPGSKDADLAQNRTDPTDASANEQVKDMQHLVSVFSKMDIGQPNNTQSAAFHSTLPVGMNAKLLAATQALTQAADHAAGRDMVDPPSHAKTVIDEAGGRAKKDDMSELSMASLVVLQNLSDAGAQSEQSRSNEEKAKQGEPVRFDPAVIATILASLHPSGEDHPAGKGKKGHS
jgi:hypothetical protein